MTANTELDQQRQTAVNLSDLEALAAKSMDRMSFDYYRSGANDELTLHENTAAFKRIQLMPFMLRDVEKRRLETTILGDQKISMPLMIAPTAFHKLAHPDGEVATIKAAVKAGTVMVLSTLSTCSIEEVAAGAAGNLWFQLYVYRDRKITEHLVRRAEAAGCRALVLTVDSPLLGRRERDVRNGFHLPEGLSVANLLSSNLEELPAHKGTSGLAQYIASLYSPAITWDDVEWLKSITSMPILLKGILRADDAEKAVAAGVAGVIVSNHGGRQLDTVPATIDCLEEIARVAGDKLEVFMDGGVRRGTDILKALALGAKGVFVGRPVLWGLAAGGQHGVEQVLEMLRQELDLAMALSGILSPDSVPRDLVRTTSDTRAARSRN